METLILVLFALALLNLGGGLWSLSLDLETAQRRREHERG